MSVFTLIHFSNSLYNSLLSCTTLYPLVFYLIWLTSFIPFWIKLLSALLKFLIAWFSTCFHAFIYLYGWYMYTDLFQRLSVLIYIEMTLTLLAKYYPGRAHWITQVRLYHLQESPSGSPRVIFRQKYPHVKSPLYQPSSVTQIPFSFNISSILGQSL